MPCLWRWLDLGVMVGCSLEDARGGKGRRPSLVRLVEKDGAMEVQAVCVVSKAKKRARSGMVFRMQALVVKELLRGRGLAAEAPRRLQVELEGLTGRKYGMVADMAAFPRALLID